MLPVVAGEERAAAEDLSKNAAGGPYVNFVGVFGAGEEEFRGSVPARHHVFGQLFLASLRTSMYCKYMSVRDGERESKGFDSWVPPQLEASTYLECAESKIANLNVAFGRHEHVAGLEVSVEDPGGVNVLERTQNLIHDVSGLLGGDVLRGLQNLMQVRLHEIVDYVQVVESWERRWWEDVAHADDVLVAAECA